MKTITDIPYNDKGPCLDLVLPEGNTFDAVFIYFHGGGLEAGSKNPSAVFISHLVQRNIAVATANYRMYPDAKFPDFIEDAADAVAWVFQHIGEYGHCDKIFAGGSSAGGYLSMMLCFDPRYLGAHGILPDDIAGYVHDAGQPTAHFNVLKERGLDSRRVIVDETAPLYFVGLAESYSPMLVIYSDNDMVNRPEQTQVLLTTLRHFGYDQSKISVIVKNGKHCAYVGRLDENGESEFAKMIAPFILEN